MVNHCLSFFFFSYVSLISFIYDMTSALMISSSEKLQIVQGWETRKPWLPKDKIDEVFEHLSSFKICLKFVGMILSYRLLSLGMGTDFL